MSDPENKGPPPAPDAPDAQKEVRVGMPMHMTSNPCGPFTVISAAAPGLVISITVNQQVWPPKALQGLLEAIAPAIGANGEQPPDSADMQWAEKPKANA